MGCCPGPLRCTFNAAKAGLEVCTGRRISALQIGWWLRDRARQIRVKPLRAQTCCPRTDLRRHAPSRNRLCSRRWRAAAAADAWRGRLDTWIDHLSGRIVKISRKRRGHEQCRKYRSIHFYSPSIKHHKYLVVANFDWNALQLVQQMSKLFSR